MLNQKSYSNSKILGHIMLSIAVFVFFAIMSGVIQMTYIITQTSGGLEAAMDTLSENIYYGIEIGSILGSYYSIIYINLYWGSNVIPVGRESLAAVPIPSLFPAEVSSPTRI